MVVLLSRITKDTKIKIFALVCLALTLLLTWGIVTTFGEDIHNPAFDFMDILHNHPYYQDGTLSTWCSSDVEGFVKLLAIEFLDNANSIYVKVDNNDCLHISVAVSRE